MSENRSWFSAFMTFFLVTMFSLVTLLSTLMGYFVGSMDCRDEVKQHEATRNLILELAGKRTQESVSVEESHMESGSVDLALDHLEENSDNVKQHPAARDAAPVVEQEESHMEEVKGSGKENGQLFSVGQTFEIANRISAEQDKPHSFFQFGGQGRNVIVGFTDPLCNNCRDAYQTFESHRQELEEYNIDILWFPVSVLSTDNREAARMLAFGHDGSQEATPQMYDAVDMNTALLGHSLQKPLVPYFVWKADEYGVMVGSPSDSDMDTIIKLFATSSQATRP